MPKVAILEKGHIGFFYRLKVEEEEAETLEDVQRFFMILKSEDASHYRLLIVGKKQLPPSEGVSHFAFVDKLASSASAVWDFLEEKSYQTKTRGNRALPHAKCVGSGAYLIAFHEQHTHLCYELQEVESEIETEFKLFPRADFIISVKNPDVSTPEGKGLAPFQKADFPLDLKEKFNDYRFIALNPPRFLDYEGAELLLTGKGSQDLMEKVPDIEKHLQSVRKDDFFEEVHLS